MKKINNPTFVDLFSGIGGFRLALEESGYRCVFSSEIERHARYTYLENFGEIPHGDIRTIDPKSVPDHDVLVAGFPCQSFSVAGNRRGFEDSRGTLFFEVAKILKAKRPQAFVLENVKGLINHDQGKTLSIILRTLRDLDYQVEWKLLNSKSFGVPQNRERIYIVGTKVRAFKFPFESKPALVVADILEPKVTENHFISTESIKKFIRTGEIVGRSPGKIQRLGYLARIAQGWIINSINGLGQCLCANGGGLGGQTGLYFIGTGRIRRLTPRECARMQGFPESFKISHRDRQAKKQFGNSITVPVAKAIAKALRKHLRR